MNEINYRQLKDNIDTLYTYVKLVERQQKTVADWAMITFMWSLVIAIDIGMIALLYKLWMWVL